VQVRRSVDGAAGPTAGQPQEDLQSNRKGFLFTMTPASKMLHPPTPEEETQRTQQHDGENSSPGASATH
jgi:hypothetical protein